MKYAHIEENTNKLLGWYDDKIHKNIPSPNIEISEEVWQNAVDNNHNKINDDGTTENYDFRTDEEKLLQQEVELKQAKEKAKANITVTTANGNTFDGNSEARLNMQNSIAASEITSITETRWKLTDNSIVTVNVTEIKEALALSIMECGRIVMATSIEEL